MKKLIYCIVVLSACSGAVEKGAEEPVVEQKPFVVEPEKPPERKPTDNQALGKMIDKNGTSIDGSPGLWKFQFDGRLVVVVTDERANRMRIVTPVAKKEDVTDALMEVMLEANFHTALDARYATSGEFLYSVFLHPLSSLTEAEFLSGLKQVVALAKNYGTSFSSGALQFQ